MITNIKATSRDGKIGTFDVSSRDGEVVNGYTSLVFEIRPETAKSHKHFFFQLVKLSEDRRLVFMINNNDHPELSGNGIVKAMIQAISEEYHCDVVSSSNLEQIKIDAAEGRIPEVTRFWKKWRTVLDNVNYLKEEDRFIFKRK